MNSERHGGSRADVAVERKAIQSLRPSGFTTAFGRAEGFEGRGGSGTAESRALTRRGEGGGGWWGLCVLRISRSSR